MGNKAKVTFIAKEPHGYVCRYSAAFWAIVHKPLKPKEHHTSNLFCYCYLGNGWYARTDISPYSEYSTNTVVIMLRNSESHFKKLAIELNIPI